MHKGVISGFLPYFVGSSTSKNDVPLAEKEKSCQTFEVLEECKVYVEHKNRCPADCSSKIGYEFQGRQSDSLSKKEKRAFQRMVTGLQIGNYQGAFMRFMTLTTSRQARQGYKYKRVLTKSGVFYFPFRYNINDDFDDLKLRIYRAKPEKDGFQGFKFNRYFKLTTDEGYGVLHIVYWGKFIPQAWLSSTWDELHQSPVVHIEACYGGPRRNVKGLVGYLLTHYLTKQPILRMSYGWKWAWLGFCKSWEHIKKVGEIRRCGLLSDTVKWVDIAPKRSDTEIRWWNFKTPEQSKMVPFLSFKFRYRKVALENWEYLMKEPLPTTRQTKFCNPDHSRFNTRLFGGG